MRWQVSAWARRPPPPPAAPSAGGSPWASSPIYVYQLGRRYFANSDGCRLLLLQADTHAVLLDQQIGKISRFPWPAQGYYYADRAAKPVQLTPHTSYLVLAVDQGKAEVCQSGTAAVAGPDISVDGPARVMDTANDPTQWTIDPIADNVKGTVMGPVNFLLFHA